MHFFISESLTKPQSSQGLKEEAAAALTEGRVLLLVIPGLAQVLSLPS